MLITVCAFVLAVLMGLLEPVIWVFNPLYLSFLPLIGSISILLSTIFLYVQIWQPLTQLELGLVPNAAHLFKQDHPLKLSRLFLLAFVVGSFICGAVLEGLERAHQHFLFLLWVIAFGAALDLLRDSWHRATRFLHPPYLVERLTDEARKSIQNGQDELLWDYLDSLAEVVVRSIEKSKLAVSTLALQAFPSLTHTFFSSSKSISRISQDKTFEKVTGVDEASYMLFFLLQRLELIYDKALRARLETICRQMIVSLGKIIVYSAKYDMSMVNFPTYFLTKFGLKAQQHHFDEVAVLTTSTLLEIARTILTEIDLAYAEIQAPFRAITNGLTALAKGTFKKDKTTSIKALVQPLFDLKGLFETAKMATHRDTAAIIEEIDRALLEFEALDQVMRALPDVSGLSSFEETPLPEAAPPFPTTDMPLA